MQVKECYVQTEIEGLIYQQPQPHDMVHMLPPLQRKRGKKRKGIPFHGIFSKFCPLNTTKLHQSYTISLKVTTLEEEQSM
jgi:hypothetical protein